MPVDFTSSAISILSGENKSVSAKLMRVATRIAEPFYAGTMRIRNSFYDRGIFASHHLGFPTISVGNITTGGTGKTPVVQWLANELRNKVKNPAILLRGYRSDSGGKSDEQMLLEAGLNDNGARTIPVIANPDRIAGAKSAVKQSPAIDTFILDDGFQHRRAARDFDLVLINATQPFGFNHVLPRGLLREPKDGLRRANAYIITHTSQVSADSLRQIEFTLKTQNPRAPIYHCDHVHTELWNPITGTRSPMSAIKEQKYFVITGIGDPPTFIRQLTIHEGIEVGRQVFADHHQYTTEDLKNIFASAQAAGATRILTTRKDWVKIQSILNDSSEALTISVVELGIAFRGQDDQHLLEQVMDSIAHAKK